MVDKVLKLLLLFSPIAFTSGIPLAVFDQIFFHLGMISLIVCSLIDKPKRDIDIKIPLLFLGLGFINLCCNNFHKIILSSFTNLFFAVAGLIVIIRYCDDVKGCFKYIAWAAIINMVVFGFQRIGFDPIFSIASQEQGGLMGNAPRMMSLLSLSFIFLSSISSYLLLLPIAIAIFTKEFSVFLIAGIVLFIKFKNVNMRLFIICLFLAGLYIFYEEILHSIIGIRFPIWIPVIKKIFNKPLIGYGMGVFPLISNQFIKSMYQVDYCFNSYIQFIFSVGIGGIVLIGYAIKKYFHKFNSRIESLGVISLLILMLFEYPIEIHRLWITIISIIGFFIIRTYKEDNHVCCLQGK